MYAIMQHCFRARRNGLRMCPPVREAAADSANAAAHAARRAAGCGSFRRRSTSNPSRAMQDNNDLGDRVLAKIPARNRARILVKMLVTDATDGRHATTRVRVRIPIRILVGFHCLFILVSFLHDSDRILVCRYFWHAHRQAPFQVCP